MAKKRRREAASTPATAHKDWSTPASRVKWLVNTRFMGNRSAFAEAVGLSHTAAGNVVAGLKEPGRKFLTAVAQQLHVNPTWLLTGEGQPYTTASDLGRAGVPVATMMLPGPPLDHQSMLEEDWVVDATDLFTSSQYWLCLTSRQLIVRATGRGFLVRDLLLMETDRAKFPREANLYDHLCVVSLPGAKPIHKLAAVTYQEADEVGPDRLEADTFAAVRQQPNITVEVYEHHPGGQIQHRRRVIPLESGHRSEMPTITYTDIVAVWTGLLGRR